MKVMRSTQKELRQCMKDNLIEYITNIWNSKHPSKWIKPYIPVFDKHIYPQYTAWDIFLTYITLKIWKHNRVYATAKAPYYSISLTKSKVYRIGDYFLVKSGDTDCYDIFRIRIGDKVSVFDDVPLPKHTPDRYVLVDNSIQPTAKLTPCLWTIHCRETLNIKDCTMCPAHCGNYHRQPELTRAEAVRWWELQTLEPAHKIIKWQEPQEVTHEA